MTTLTLSDLTARTGLDVLDHLERDVTIPVTGGLQAQGDLLVIPLAMLGKAVSIDSWASWLEVPADGVEVLRGAAGGNPHTLVAEPGACEWTTNLADTTRLAIGAFRTTAPAYLLHPEHGGSGIAPGTYVIRRQRERGMAPTPFSGVRTGGVRFIAD
ncbi:hypothetical protein [Actinomadura kijaniata]|uniref:hypothetical protein n=1 Tax=Actinomadura kijaniata TaxID=46161 RepID=UPI000ABD6EA0|nr:hypothetical protein [Actinomadura kijaniata]